MSWVSIWKPVNDRIVLASRGTENEIVGLLLGRLEDDAIIIEDSITGEYSAEPHRVTLPPDALAKIADALVTGRIKGSIVGWYHSHTEGGLFFSETDITTQKVLQQFSSLITGMVVDASNGEVGFFRVDPQTRTAVRIPPERIRVYSEPSKAVPPQEIAKPRTATPIVEVRRGLVSPRPLPRRVILAFVLIVLVVSLTIVGVLLYAGLHAPALAIVHAPISAGTVGAPIRITANVTGAAKNVSLAYSTIGGNYNQVLMNPIAGNSYAYVIPGNQVTANIVYYIAAFDSAGNKVSTSTYTIVVGDFSILPQITTFSVYRNSTKSFDLQMRIIQQNGFAEPISFSEAGAPQGVSVRFTPNPAPPGTTTVDVMVSAGAGTPTGTASLTLMATYAPPASTPVSRQSTLSMTVSDFGLQVNPASAVVAAGSVATFNVSLTLENGFVDPVSINVAGVPPTAKYQWSSTSIVLGGGPGTRTLVLQITVPTSTKRTTYTMTISAVGGGVSHSQTVQLIVR